MRRTTAVANPNIALVKYWGKRDETQGLPCNDSVSITWEGLSTTTTLESAAAFSFELDGRVASKAATRRVRAFLGHFTEDVDAVRVISHNTVPTGAGFASSASAFAALGVAADRFFATGFPGPALASIVRKGSGSAIRSLHGGAVHFSRDGQAYPLEAHLDDLALIPVTIDSSEKTVSSREGMKRAVATSSFHPVFVSLGNRYAKSLVKALKAGDLDGIGRTMERHAHAMHATMMTSDPPVRYLRDASHRVMDTVRTLRHEGVACYYTMDAGPNVKILTRAHHVKAVRAALREAGHSLMDTLRPALEGARIIHDER